MEATDEERGLLMVQGLVEQQEDTVDDIDRELEALNDAMLESGVDFEGEEEFQTLSEKEAEQAGEAERVHLHTQEDEHMVNGEDSVKKEMEAGEMASRQGHRKRLFKPNVSTAGSNKMRMASALVSPRKKATTKNGTHHGDSNKPPEGKGPSNPKPANLKF